MSGIISAWRFVAKRGLAHWRLLSSVVVGVLMASAIMAGTVVYFDALRELALDNALDRLSPREADILVRADKGPTTYEELAKVADTVRGEVDVWVQWLLRGEERGARSSTFFVAAPGSVEAAGEDNARAYFAYLEGFEAHATILPGGRTPRDGVLSAPGEPLAMEALVPVDAAEVFGLSVGDRLAVVPFWQDATPYAIVVVAGIFGREDPDAEFWYLDDAVLRASTGSHFRTIQFLVSQKTFMEVVGAAFPDMSSTFAWLLEVDKGRLDARNAARASLDVGALRDRLGARLFGFRQTTLLARTLAEHETRLFFTRLPMFVVLVLIAAVVLYYVATLSSLVTEQQRGELALLRSRGASPGQVLAVFVLEGLAISALAVVAGPLLAGAAVSVLGLTPAFSDLSGGAMLRVTVGLGAYGMSALGALLSFAALMVPAVHASRLEVAEHRQAAARPARLPAFQRYYADVMLLAVGVVLFRQLAEQGSLAATSVFGDVFVNQLLLAVPAVILVASAMVLLRLFPLALALGSRLLSGWLSAGPVLGLWQMARNPTHYARLSLLLILTAGLGIFVASFGATLGRSFEERVLYATGSDIRVEGIAPNVSGTTVPLAATYEGLAGVDQVSPAFRGGGYDVTSLFGKPYDMLAVDLDRFPQVAWFRDDFASRPLAALLASLRYDTSPEGVPLPPTAKTISVMVKPDRAHPTVRLVAQLRDANGRYFARTLGWLGEGGWMLLTTSIPPTPISRSRPALEAVPPLSLVSINLEETDFRSNLEAGSVLLDRIEVSDAAGTTDVVEAFDEVARWSVLRASIDSVADELRRADVGPGGATGSALFAWSAGSAFASRGIFRGPPLNPLPVLATRSFVQQTGHPVGSELDVSVRSRRVRVKIVEEIDFFPTLDTIGQRFLVADLDSLTRVANLEVAVGDFWPNEVWIASRTTGAERQRLAERLATDPFPSRVVRDREHEMASSRVDPLIQAGWRALLWVAFGAVLALSCMGFLVHAYVSFRNREAQFALLRTMGLSVGQLTSLVLLEQLLVIGAGLALGTWMGGRLGATIMPFLGYDDRGGHLLPPFLVEYEWGILVGVYLAMGLVFALVIGGVVFFVRRISLQKVLRLGDG